MTGQEIRKRIDENNLKIREAVETKFFTLNDDINKAIEDNYYLRSICKHDFEDGVCKWCDDFATEEDE